MSSVRDFPIHRRVSLPGHLPEPLRIQNPGKHLDHAKREVVAARYYDVLAEAIEEAAGKQTER